MAGEMRAYEPTMRERGAEWLQEKLRRLGGYSNYRAGEISRNLTGAGQTMGVADATPLGLLFGAEEGGASFGRGAAQMGQGDVAGGLLGMGVGALSLAGAPVGKVSKAAATVMRPKRIAYPGIYDDPRSLVAEATSRVAPENPLMKQLFGVTRDDLFDLSEQGARKGNMTERPFAAGAKAKGAKHASEVMNPRNTQRLQDLIGEAQKSPELYKGMASWYEMDPLFNRFKEIYGPEEAVARYNKFNTLTGMASPGSEVLTEFNRGTGAHWLDEQGRFSDFQKFGGMAENNRKKAFPADMRGIIGHPYHSTAHSTPMAAYLATGDAGMKSAKVPSYIAASGVPETGFQREWPVVDAHHARIMGLPDVRGATTSKGVETVPNASASMPEALSVGPWWREKVAEPMGLSAVGGQAVVWGAGSGATGVTSPIGAPKLELLAQQIGKAAQRMGVSPETARDMILRGQAHAGAANPELLAAIAAATGGAAGINYLLSDPPPAQK